MRAGAEYDGRNWPASAAAAAMARGGHRTATAARGRSAEATSPAPALHDREMCPLARAARRRRREGAPNKHGVTAHVASAGVFRLRRRSRPGAGGPARKGDSYSQFQLGLAGMQEMAAGLGL